MADPTPTPSDPPNSFELLARWRAHDKTARDALIAHSQDRIRRIASSRLRMTFLTRAADIHTSDLLQETNRRLYNLLDKGLPKVPESDVQFFALVTRMMRYALLDLWRMYNQPQWHTRGLPDGVEQVAEDPPKVDREVQLLELVERLPEQERIAFTLRHFEGLGYAEIAEQMGVAVGTAFNLVGRAMQLLKEMANSDGSDEISPTG